MSAPDFENDLEPIASDWLEAQRNGNKARAAELLEAHPSLVAFRDDYEALDRRFAPLRKLTGATPSTAAEIVTMGALDTAVEPLKPGASFGDYDLLSEVARGGMGIVYKARQKSLNRVVALKMVLGEGPRACVDRERFLVEARAVARLSHPHIVPIYEVGEHKGQPYFTMEYLSGGSLREHMANVRGDYRAIATLVVTISRAIEHAHRRGILHRDIKPSNILLDERREPHVTDFGLAKRIGEESDLTQAGAIVGTPSYMAPEQAGAQTDLSTAVDVYGVGALFYEMLTGRPPFQGRSPMETMMQVVSEEPERVTRLAPDVDRDLETICHKCLEKDPLSRYGSADALADDLERWLAGKPIEARAATTVERAVKWSRRQPLLAGAYGAISLAVIGLLVLSGFLWHNAEARAGYLQTIGEGKTQLAQVTGAKEAAEKDRAQAEAERGAAQKQADEQTKIAAEQKVVADKIGDEVKELRTAAEKAKAQAAAAQEQLVAAQREAKSTLYAADMQLAHAAWQSDNIPAASELLERYLKPAAGDDPRGLEWYFLNGQLNSARLSWRVTPSEKNGLSSVVASAISPDGATLVTAHVGNELNLWDLADGKRRQHTKLISNPINGMSFTNVTGVFFADEGKKVVAVARKSFDMRKMDQLVAAAMNAKTPFSLNAIGESLEFQTWLPESGKPVTKEPFEAKRLEGNVLPTLAGSFFLVDEGQMIMVMALTRSADGKFLGLVGAESRVAGGDPKRPGGLTGGRLIVWNLLENKVHAQQSSPVPITAVAFSPTSDALAVATSDGAVGVGKVDLAQPPQLMLGHRGQVYGLCFGPDGKHLASSAADGLVILWDVASAKEAKRLRGHTSAVMSVKFSPDGKSLVSGSMDGVVKVWDLAHSARPMVLSGHNSPVLGLAFSANSEELLSLDHSGQAKTWSTARGEMLPAPATWNAKALVAGAANQAVNTLAGRLSPSGLLFVAKQGLNDALKVRDLTTGKETELKWKDHVPLKAVFSPDDKLVAAVDIGDRGGIGVWNVADGKLVATLDLKGTMFGCTFSPDGRFIATTNPKGALVWGWETGATKPFEQGEDTGATAVAFSPDGKLLAVAGNTRPAYPTKVNVWNVESGALVANCGGAGQQVMHLAFSPDGRRLATGGMTSSQQGLLKLWDTASGREVFTAAIPPVTITALSFSPNGAYLAAATQAFDVSASLTGRKVPADVYVWAGVTTNEKESAAIEGNKP